MGHRKTEKEKMISDQRIKECFWKKLPSNLALKTDKTSAKVNEKPEYNWESIVQVHSFLSVLGTLDIVDTASSHNALGKSATLTMEKV